MCRSQGSHQSHVQHAIAYLGWGARGGLFRLLDTMTANENIVTDASSLVLLWWIHITLFDSKPWSGGAPSAPGGLIAA